MESIRVLSLIVALQLIGAVLASWPAFLASPILQQANSPYGPIRPPEPDYVYHDAPQCTCVREINTLVSQLTSEQKRVTTLQKRVDEMAGMLFNTHELLQEAAKNGRMMARPSNQAGEVAFYARVGSNRPFLKSTDIIVFDEVVENNGGHYDAYTGKLTVPVDGTYHLSSTILSDFNATIETMLVINGQERARMYSGAFNNRGSGSVTALLNMKRGDEAWVSVFYGNGDYVHGQWSTFTGFLINSVY